MDKLIPVINKLQDVFNTVGRETIQLPQIAVIGTQSTGKSSVLENIVGKDFLPRGSGIVTRRPLILQLVHISNAEANGSWGWGKFLHTGDENKFDDFTKIREKIEEETEHMAGANKGISDIPIRLSIYSPNVLNLTLIDLPGITRVPVGDQPGDIETQIRTMLIEYIKSPKCIILAVHSANTDLATSEALKLAKEIDVEGKRTLVVCTKLDLMDHGTDASDLLSGKIIPVKLGIIGVVNRSQQDIIDSKPITAALKDEQMFFRRRYPAFASRNGTPYLAKTLNKLLMQHIRDTLPILRHDIVSKLTVYESQLQALGQPVEKKGHALLQTLTKFSTAYCHKVEGTSRDIETNQLSGGARICYIFHHTFSEALNSIRPLEGLSRTDVLHAISNAMGPRPALFVSEMAFELLVKRQIRLLLHPSLQCVELVYEELQRIIQYSLSNIRDFQRFPTLRERMNTVVMDLIRKSLPITNRMVEDLISIEMAYINTNHPDFVGGTRAAYESYMMALTQSNVLEPNQFNSNVSADTLSTSPAMIASSSSQPDRLVKSTSTTGIASSSSQPDRPGSFGQKSWLSSTFQRTNPESMSVSSINIKGVEGDSGLNMVGESSCYAAVEERGGGEKIAISQQQFDCKLIEKLIKSYFLIVRKSVQDVVPKAVMHCLVNHVMEELQSQLVGELYRTESFDSLMEESPEMTIQRKEVTDMVATLQKANEILNEIRDLQFESQIIGFTECGDF